MRHTLLLGLLSLSACPIPDEPLDYTDDALWLCSGADDDCDEPFTVHTVEEDGSRTAETLTPGELQVAACFVVYPTVDLRPVAELHMNTKRVDAPRDWVLGQARMLNEVCEVWAPVYRQVTIGSYLPPSTDRKERLFDAAYADVKAAWRHFLEQNPSGPIAVVGHSQGAQHLSRLLHEEVEDDDDLMDRLVAAYPLGWSLGTEDGSDVGGSFDTLPVCTSGQQVGCVVGYRSFLSGQEVPALSDRLEGESQVCWNPASPNDPEAKAVLRTFMAPGNSSFVSIPREIPAEDFVRWNNAFEARCVGEPERRSLRIDWVRDDDVPFGVAALLFGGDNGTHVLDVNLGIADIVTDLHTRWDGRMWE